MKTTTLSTNVLVKEMANKQEFIDLKSYKQNNQNILSLANSVARSKQESLIKQLNFNLICIKKELNLIDKHTAYSQYIKKENIFNILEDSDKKLGVTFLTEPTEILTPENNEKIKELMEQSIFNNFLMISQEIEQCQSNYFVFGVLIDSDDRLVYDRCYFITLQSISNTDLELKDIIDIECIEYIDTEELPTVKEIYNSLLRLTNKKPLITPLPKTKVKPQQQNKSNVSNIGSKPSKKGFFNKLSDFLK